MPHLDLQLHKWLNYKHTFIYIGDSSEEGMRKTLCRSNIALKNALSLAARTSS